MKKINNLVSLVLMSIFTVVSSFSFTACSDDLDSVGSANNQEMPQGAQTALLEAYGMSYENFINDDDVMILDADTTMLSVSKEYADKMGYTSFVGHPMGIWHQINQLPYIRKATAEKLVGDRYILNVVPATVAEIIGDKKVTLNTGLYVNPDADNGGVTRAAGGMMVPGYAAKYIDENAVVHPAVILLTDPYGYDKGYHFDDEQPKQTTRAASDGYQYMTADDMLAGTTRGSIHKRILSFTSSLEMDKNFQCGENEEDSINIRAELPIDFDLNYFLTLDGGVKWKFIVPVPCVEKFEAGVDGKFAFSPQFKIGFKKEWKLDEDKWKKNLITFSSYTFTFWLGPVPVAVKCDPNLYLKLDGKVTGAVDLGFKYEYENNFKAGVRYTDSNGWSTINEFNEVKNDFSLIKPELEVHAEAGVGIYFGMDVMIYGVAGPEVAVGPRLGAEATMTLSPFEQEKFNLDAEVKLTVNAVAGAKLKVLGYELAEWNSTFRLAGPWTIWKYPSDGTEHVVSNWMSDDWKNFFNAMSNDNVYGERFNAEFNATVKMVQAVNGINQKTAERKVYQEMMTWCNGCPQVDSHQYCNLIDHLAYYKSEQEKLYNDYEYQKHAEQGDIAWINAYNWKQICEQIAINYISKDHMANFEEHAVDVHQWFLAEFHREPTLATSEDIDWLIKHFRDYAMYKAATMQPTGKKADYTDETIEVYTQEQEDAAWQQARQQLEAMFPAYFTGSSPKGPKHFSSIRRSFFNDYHHQFGTEQGDMQIVIDNFKRRLNIQ